MHKFRATAVNGKGWRFYFTFMACNWCGIDKVANEALSVLVASNPDHSRYGPWQARNIDVTV